MPNLATPIADPVRELEVLAGQLEGFPELVKSRDRDARHTAVALAEVVRRFAKAWNRPGLSIPARERLAKAAEDIIAALKPPLASGEAVIFAKRAAAPDPLRVCDRILARLAAADLAELAADDPDLGPLAAHVANLVQALADEELEAARPRV